MSAESRHLAELAKQVTSSGLEDLLRITPTCVALLDSAGRILIANPAFEALQRTAPGSRSIFDLVLPAGKDQLHSLLKGLNPRQPSAELQLDFRSEAEPLRCNCRLNQLPGGILLYVELASAGAEAGNDDHQLRAELEDARTALANKTVELQAVIAQADELAHTDALTFLPNRRLIVTQIQREVTRAERYSWPLTVSMLDLDTFKLVNDKYGHAAGDSVLRTVSRELRAHIRQPDEIGRYGGDEFLVILPNSGASAATEQAARLCEQVRSMRLTIHDEPVRLTLSVGIAQLRRRAEDWQGLLDRADHALYEAKAAGGNCWKISEG